MQGKFITLEGCDGVGKSTQLALLKDFFCEKGKDFLFTREPGGTPVSEKIRKIIMDGANKDMDGYTELMLYIASRRQHVKEVILPALEAGKIVVCDRFSHSTLAYQGYGRGLDKDLIDKLNEVALCGIKIDLTFFLDLSPSACFARKGGSSGDRLEEENAAFFERVYKGFCSIKHPDYVIIDASASKEEIFANIVKELNKRGIVQ